MSTTPKLTRAMRYALYDVCSGARMTTARWREYLPLSKRGLVDILDSGRAFGQLFGMSTRDVEPTSKGRELARELVKSDVDAWATAIAHAEHGRAKFPNRRMCMCGPCLAVCNVWRDAGYVWPRSAA